MTRRSGSRELIIALGLTMVFLVPACGQNAELTDRSKVFCLSEDHQDELAAAGRALGLLAAAPDDDVIRLPGGQEVTSRQWLDRQAEPFRRACSAVVPAAPSGAPASPVSVWLPFLTAVVAAFLTYLGARVRDLWLYRTQQAQALRLALASFRSATESYVREQLSRPDTPPSGREVHDRRSDLRVELHRIGLTRRRCQATEELVRLLADNLGEHVTEGWRGAGLDTRADQVRTALNDLQHRALALARRLERPFARTPVSGRRGGTASGA